MATIRSYTDLEQSKKLAEILPIESADMQWFLEEDYGIVQIKEGLQDWGGDCTIPCWSLAALINILPRFIEFKSDKYYLQFMKEYVEYANDEVSITGRCLHTTGNDNLVDACYEMIIKLHKEGLL